MNWHPLLPDFAKANENYYCWSNLPKLAGLSLLYALHGGAYFLAAGPKQSLRRRRHTFARLPVDQSNGNRRRLCEHTIR